MLTKVVQIFTTGGVHVENQYGFQSKLICSKLEFHQSAVHLYRTSTLCIVYVQKLGEPVNLEGCLLLDMFHLFYGTGLWNKSYFGKTFET